MARRLIWSQRARLDLKEIIDFISAEGAGECRRRVRTDSVIVAAIVDGVRLLKNTPPLWQASRFEGFR